MLSTLFDPVYVRAEKEKDPSYIRQCCTQVKQLIAQYSDIFSLNKENTNVPMKYLAYHAELCTLYANVLIAYLGDGTEQEQQQAKSDFLAALYTAEPEIHAGLDVNNLIDSIFNRYLRRHTKKA